ncbi:MAG: T9SS type A sorting domain-containing protein, partial [Flavobacteriales bacterium]
VICEGAEAQIIATSQFAGSNPIYQWYAEGLAVGDGNDTLNYTINSTQNITCTVTSDISCASPAQASSCVLTIVPQPFITPELTITANTDTITAGQFVTFTATATNAGSTPAYQWYINGIELSGATSSTYTSGSIGNGQTITCRLTGQIPCSSVATVTSNGITIVVQQPNSIDEWDGDKEMLIYPNPSMGEITFKAKHAGTFYIVNDAGQLVREIRLNNSNNFQLKVDNLASGAYIVAGQNEFGIVKEKLIIAK